MRRKPPDILALYAIAMMCAIAAPDGWFERIRARWGPLQ
jgi:hypothetical protein